jgi:hypothetical protein
MMYYEKKDFHPLNSKFMQRRENREREREREQMERRWGLEQLLSNGEIILY